MTRLLLWGNAYAQIIRNGCGEVVALYPLMPKRMTADRSSVERIPCQYNTSSDETPTMKGSVVDLPFEQVLHIPGPGFDGLAGYSPIAMARNAIGMAVACEEYGAKFFTNSATPGGIWSTQAWSRIRPGQGTAGIRRFKESQRQQGSGALRKA